MAKSITFENSDFNLIGAILEFAYWAYESNNMPSMAKLCGDYLIRIRSNSGLTDSEIAMVQSGERIKARND